MKTFTIAPKACRHCCRTFSPVVNNQVVCADCRPAANREYNRASLIRCGGHVGFIPKPCVVCGAQFVPTASRAKYCDEHRIVGERAKRMRHHRKTWLARRRDPMRIVKSAVRAAVSRMAIQKRKRSFAYAGYSPDQLRRHIESLFAPGMTWENYGLWHIDHKKPLAKFRFVRADGTIDEDEVRAACSLSNLQPLWAVENLSKGAR